MGCGSPVDMRGRWSCSCARLNKYLYHLSHVLFLQVAARAHMVPAPRRGSRGGRSLAYGVSASGGAAGPDACRRFYWCSLLLVCTKATALHKPLPLPPALHWASLRAGICSSTSQATRALPSSASWPHVCARACSRGPERSRRARWGSGCGPVLGEGEGSHIWWQERRVLARASSAAGVYTVRRWGTSWGARRVLLAHTMAVVHGARARRLPRRGFQLCQ